jgi:REP element-mobilizing transposase RayT
VNAYVLMTNHLHLLLTPSDVATRVRLRLTRATRAAAATPATL